MSDSARKKQPISPGREAGATPNANARLEPSTPFLRAFNAGPTPGSRRTPTFRTPGTARTPRGGPATRPISARRVAPTTPHAIRALRERANAARTPGNNRRRSGRVQRETPRDILRDLSRVLARDSRPIQPSPQTQPKRTRHSALDLPDLEDGPQVPAPRLSMPLEDMYDDDSLHERPPRQSLLPELPDDVDGETIQSLEFGRRVLSEDPRRAGRVSGRFDDLSELGAVEEEEYEVDGTFINQRRTPGFDMLLDRNIDNVLDEDDTTARVLNGRENGPSSDMDLGVFGEADDDTQEATFRFHIPDRIPAPLREEFEDNAPDVLDGDMELPDAREEEDDATLPGIQGDDDVTQPGLQAEDDEEPLAEEDEEEENEDRDADGDEGELTRLVEDDPTDAFGMTGWESDPGLEDPQLTAYREEESAFDRSLQSPEHAAAVKKRLGGRRKELRVSRYGLDYPSFPAASVKKLAMGLTQSRGSKGKISKDTLDVLVQTTDDFLEQIGGDLAAYAQHGGRKVIEESDVIALMKRTRKTTNNNTAFSLAQKLLPRELLQHLRMEPRRKLKGQKRKRVPATQEEDG